MQDSISASSGLPLSVISDNEDDMSSMLQAFTAAFSVILISELGDKTFIISAIMSMENSRTLVFFASAGALGLMTVLSVIVGVAVTIIPKMYSHYASMILFLCFGFRMLQEAYVMKDNNPDSEFDEVKRVLEEETKPKCNDMPLAYTKTTTTFVGKKPEMYDSNNNILPAQESPQIRPKVSQKNLWLKKAGPLVIQVFTMTFLAEWGDRSQISTVILAARNNAMGVLAGALLGHLLCTGLAVLAGRFVAEMISVRTMTFLGGLTFLGFASYAALFGAE